jgi:hypothetical protein
MVVAWNMSERHMFYYVLKTKSEDSLVLFVTFLLTVFVNLTVADSVLHSEPNLSSSTFTISKGSTVIVFEMEHS